MSQYIRYLIEFAILVDELNLMDDKKYISNKKIDKIINLLGGTINE